MSANYNIFNNLDISESWGLKNISDSGTGNDSDIPFGYDVIDERREIDVTLENPIYSGDYTFVLDSDSNIYTLYNYSGLNSILIIPSKFKGKQITKIADFAFFGNKNLLSVVIPDNITYLGNLSLGDCTFLKKVTFS